MGEERREEEGREGQLQLDGRRRAPKDRTELVLRGRKETKTETRSADTQGTLLRDENLLFSFSKARKTSS